MRKPRSNRRLIRSTVGAALVAVSLGASTLFASPAQAEPVGFMYNVRTCGWATCTLYWSVDRTNELQVEWKETLVGVGVGAPTSVGAIAAAAGASTVAAAAGVVAAMAAVRGVEFTHMINGAAADHRCLIYKYPAHNLALGWFGSVNLSNSNCNQGPV